MVNKPANLATQGAASGEPSLVEIAKQYIKQTYNKPGNVYLGVVSRLDAMVTGAIVLARTSKAAGRLNDQFRQRTVRKIYWAAAPDNLPGSDGELVDYLCKNESKHRMTVCDKDAHDAKLARLRYRRLQRLSDGLALWEIQLETGRKHQIRVQLSSRDCAIVGDRKYDSLSSFGRKNGGIALHARELGFLHPTTKEPLLFTAELPTRWTTLGIV